MIRAGCSAGMLRADLVRRGLELANRDRLLYEVSSGSSASLVFGVDDTGRHGNFLPDAYAAIVADPAWSVRLTKVHTASKRERVLANWRWMELDCVNSSDALLMNIFCHPGVSGNEGMRPQVASLLGVDGLSRPCFGIHPGVPLNTGRVDRTEVDMRMGDLFVEAKLTESGFQNAQLKTIERYLELETVFDVGRLPWTRTGVVQGYQLIRNVLAAHAFGYSFCVLLDARRFDLIDSWYEVVSAVRLPNFTWKLKMLTWQELASAVPDELQSFLESKYGILCA